MIKIAKYAATWRLERNGLRIRRCVESNRLIWPYQEMYEGYEYTYPIVIHHMRPQDYTLLKLANKI